MKKGIVSVTPPPLGFNQPTFNHVASEFDRSLYQKGYEVYVEKALRCPCLVKANSSPTPSCRNCGGSGWFFVNRSSTILMIQSIDLKKDFRDWSEINFGTVSVTARNVDRLVFMDKITVLDIDSIHNQVLKPNRVNGKLLAIFDYVPLDLLEIYLFDSPEKPLVPLKEGDYEIDYNVFRLNDEFFHYANPQVSVRYYHNPVYYVLDITRDSLKSRSKGGRMCSVLDLPSDIKEEREKLDSLPIHCYARRAHLVLDAPNLNGDFLIDNSDYEKYDIDSRGFKRDCKRIKCKESGI